MRLSAFFYACKCHFTRGVQMNPLLNTPRIITVKLYHVQCSNESMSVWKLPGLSKMQLHGTADPPLSK